MILRHLARTVVPLAVLSLVAAACSSDDAAPTTTEPVATTDAAPDTTATPETTTAPETTAAPDTTVAPETTTTEPAPDPSEAATAYTELGPHPVGVTTLQLASGPLVEVWYPAPEGTTGEDTYDMRDFVPESILALLTGDVDTTVTIAAGRDVPVADELFPLVLFSHGASGLRLQSTALTAHLASWGFVVAAPDHPSRDLMSALGGASSPEPTDSVDDLLGARDLLLAESADSASVFFERIDASNVAAVGHSAGGGTVLLAAADPDVDGYVSMASGASAELPDVPSFFIAGTTDFVVSADERTRPAFEAAPAPSLLWIIEGAGHNAFDDFCTFGGGTGIIGIAEAAGLGALLEGLPQLRSLGSDGCEPPSVPVDVTFPIINHSVTSWLRSLFGIDAEPVGLGPEVADAYEVPIEIEVKG